MEQHVEVRYVREITSTIHTNILATSDLIYVKATSIQEDYIGTFLFNCGNALRDIKYYLQMETYCNTVRVMIHNGIVKTL